jgi:hypothetical protein
VVSRLLAKSKEPELKLFYSYTIADDVSRVGITLVEVIDTKRTEDQLIAVNMYNARERDIIEVFVDDGDQGILYAEEGQTMRITCSYKTKYNFFRHWTWRRTSLLSDIREQTVHPLHYNAIAVSGGDDGQLVDDGYEVTVQDYEVDDGHIFVSTLIVKNFNSQQHSAVYHFTAEDWAMASIQPWVLRVDRFVELVPSGSTSLLDPAQLYPIDDPYLEVSTCSKKGSDTTKVVTLDPEEPDCVVCISYGGTTPHLTKDGAALPDVRAWPLTVRSPHLNLVYVVMSRPSERDNGLYRCSSDTSDTSSQKTPTMEILVL